MPEITIKKGKLKVTLDRNELFDVSETHDGIVFNFKDGLSLYQVDNNMPSHVKQRIVNSSSAFEKGNLIFDLNNYNIPVTVDVT